MLNRWMPWIATFALILTLTACAAGANTFTDVNDPETGELAGFWMGLWHGIILPITFIISLFSDTVGIYEQYNTGGWYDFGFAIGVLIFHGGGAAGAGRAGRRWRRNDD